MATSTPPREPDTIAPPEAFDGGRPMTIIEHLMELRTRLVWCCIGFVIALVISFVFVNQILDFLVQPMRDRAPNADLIFTSPLENFTSTFKVALYGALVLAMPVFVYETLMFVLPGLTPTEKRWVLPIVGGIFLCMIVGVAFAYYVTLPPALGFLLNFNTDIAKAQIRLGEYISFTTRLVFWVGVTFETPMFIFALARFGLITWRRLLGWWRYIIVLVFVIAAIVTPTPDPITQTLVAGPMLGLYLIGVLLAFLFGRDRQRP
jgi:sec-independent protein translocase protein TatC